MKASDNAFPSLLLVEGIAPATPAAGQHRLFVDTADGLVKRKAPDGTVSTVEGGGGGGGGGADWTLVYDRSLLSDSDLTNVSTDGGSWTQDANGWHVAASGGNFRRRFTAVAIDPSDGVMQCDVRINSGANDNNGGIAYGSDSGGHGERVDLRSDGTQVAKVGYEDDMNVGLGTTVLPAPIAFGTWVTMLVRFHANTAKVYLNGVLFETHAMNPVGRSHIGLAGNNAAASWRNLKVWQRNIDFSPADLP